MTTIINGSSPSVTFSDSTTQSSSGLVVGTASAITSGTAQASTSGTSIDFTSIPSWVKRITVMFNGVSLSGTSYPIIRLGTGGTPTTTGYDSASSQLYSAVGSVSTGAGFIIFSNVASYVINGSFVFTNISGNTWVGQGTFGNTTTLTLTITCGGSIALSGVLNMVRITALNGTDTFDAGSINILYE